ncbi:Hypothetical predicted protein [Mytilus galloprovincialis]|uniref:TIR domain-containing protein n=1 Tax=Mytilus galloprovincialis TaxID=29158 RepID=A0A8B6HQD2_MYTGA|nr:Hypothetical predicted protein [Mytilus galloprovincialis]
MPSTALRCTDELRELVITKNSFHEIDLQTFKLNTLKMSSIFRYYQIIKPHTHSKLLMASIEHLMLQNLSFGMFPTDLGIFEGLHHLKSLDLSYSNLPFSPMASKKVFKSLSNLTKLSLQFVEITYLSWSRFGYLKYLEEIDFSNNRIFISGKLSVPSAILSLKSLDISNNAYYCTCEILSFFEELSFNNVTIKHYPEAYICTSPRSMAGKDFQYGRLIVDNIVENMKNSRKIVLILSESFAESKWCQFEVLLANERFLEHGPDSLISIKLEEITTFRMTNTLETLIKFATHAVWSNQNKEEFSVRILDCFQVKTDYIDRNNSNRSKHRCSHSHAPKMKVEENRNKILSDKLFNEMCSRVDLMSETLCRRMDSLEKTVKSDINFLKNKVDKLETNLTSLQDSIIDSQSTSK